MNNRILFVDDDPNILKGFQRNLRKHFEISVAENGQAGLDMITSTGPFAVIVSDMQMPDMNGLEFLAATRKLDPDCVKIMLTGNADDQTPIKAINKVDVYKYVNKPCPPETMSTLLTLALARYQRIQLEKEKLISTVNGSFAALSELLAITRPDTVRQSARIKELASMILDNVQASVDWDLDALAHLCQLGYVTLPTNVMDKLSNIASFTDQEQAQFAKHPQVACHLLSNIPGIEKLVDVIKYQMKGFDGSGPPNDSLKGKEIPFGARLLKVVIDFNLLEQHSTVTQAATTLQKKNYLYDPELLSSLLVAVDANHGERVLELSVAHLTVGMIIAEDLKTSEGALLMSEGQVITRAMIDRLIIFGANKSIPGKIRVYVLPDESDSAE